jgi:hypothetical protein
MFEKMSLLEQSIFKMSHLFESPCGEDTLKEHSFKEEDKFCVD